MHFFIHSGNEEHEFLNRDCMVMAEVDQRKTACFPCRETFARQKRNPYSFGWKDVSRNRESYAYQSWHIGVLTALNPALAEVREA